MMLNVWRSAFAVALIVSLPVAVGSADLTIGFDGISNIKIGTPLSNISVRLEQPIQKFDQDRSGHCFYAYPENDKRYSLMFIDDVLVRIDVMQAGLRTTEGVEVGDPVSKVRKLYGGAIKDEPNAYDDSERYLTISARDGKFSIRFMTGDGKVSAIISGTEKSVQYIEGCL